MWVILALLDPDSETDPDPLTRLKLQPFIFWTCLRIGSQNISNKIKIININFSAFQFGTKFQTSVVFYVSFKNCTQKAHSVRNAAENFQHERRWTRQVFPRLCFLRGSQLCQRHRTNLLYWQVSWLNLNISQTFLFTIFFILLSK